MKAKLAFLTSPQPGVYLLNYQEEGKDGLCQVEITEAHLANIVIDGASFALRSSRRVSEAHKESAEHVRTDVGA